MHTLQYKLQMNPHGYVRFNLLIMDLSGGILNKKYAVIKVFSFENYKWI